MRCIADFRSNPLNRLTEECGTQRMLLGFVLWLLDHVLFMMQIILLAFRSSKACHTLTIMLTKHEASFSFSGQSAHVSSIWKRGASPEWCDPWKALLCAF